LSNIISFNTKYVQSWRCIVSSLLKNYETFSHHPVRNAEQCPPKMCYIDSYRRYVRTYASEAEYALSVGIYILYILLRDKRDSVRVYVLCTYAYTALRSTLFASLSLRIRVVYLKKESEPRLLVACATSEMHTVLTCQLSLCHSLW